MTGIKRQKRTSRQHERLQARACGYSEAVPTEHEETDRQQILDELIVHKSGTNKYRRPHEFHLKLSLQLLPDDGLQSLID